jgi:hypothetical protein
MKYLLSKKKDAEKDPKTENMIYANEFTGCSVMINADCDVMGKSSCSTKSYWYP